MGPDYKVIRENPDVILNEIKEKYRSNHIGCPDVYQGIVYLALEDGAKDQEGKNYKHLVIAACNPETLTIIRWVYGVDDSSNPDKYVFKIDLKTGETKILFRVNDALESSVAGYLLSKLSYWLFRLSEGLKQLTKGYINLGLKYIKIEGIAFYLAAEGGEPILHVSMILYIWVAFLKYVIIHYRRIVPHKTA